MTGGLYIFLLTYSIEQSPSGEVNHLSVSQEIPHIPLPLDPSLILSYHICLGFPTNTLYTPLLSPICTTCPAHFILLDFITQTILGEKCRSLSSSLCSFLHPLVTSSLLSPNILLNTLFSNTLNLCSSLNISNQVSQPYKTTGKIIVLYISNFKFLESKLEDKRFSTKWQQEFPVFNLFLISSWIQFWCVKVVTKYLNFSTLSKELLPNFILRLQLAFWSRDMTVYLVLSAFTPEPSQWRTLKQRWNAMTIEHLLVSNHS